MGHLRNENRKRLAEHAASLCWLLLLFLSCASAQQLSLRRYGVAQGLAHNSVHCIYQDRKGYLWIGTSEGLSCFDGYRFTNYTTRDGLEHNNVNDLTEDPEGRLWIATSKGVARFIDRSDNSSVKEQKKLVVLPVGDSLKANIISVLKCDKENRLWCGTYEGLYRGVVGQDGQAHFEYTAPGGEAVWGNSAFADGQNRLWFGLGIEYLEVEQGRVTPHPLPKEVSHEEIAAITADGQGGFLVANLTGYFNIGSLATGGESGRGSPSRSIFTGRASTQ